MPVNLTKPAISTDPANPDVWGAALNANATAIEQAVAGLDTAVAGKVSTSALGVTVATLDGTGKVPAAQLPASGTSALDDLVDVALSAPSDGQVLKYLSGQWVNGTDAQGSGGSGGGAATPSAGVRYVTTDGSDSNDGLSWATAKATIAAAESALPATGGVIQLGVGTWNGRFAITKPDVELRGMGWSTVLRLPNATNVTAQTLTITGDRVVVRNLKIDGNRANNSDVTDGYSDGIGVYASDTLVERCWITGARSHAYIVWGDNTTAGGSAANASRTAGVRRGNMLRSCLIDENGTASDNRAAVDWAFLVNGTPAPEDNSAVGNLVIGNVNGRTCFTSHSSKRLLIHGNVMHGVNGGGRMIELHTDTEDAIVSNNLFIAKNLVSDGVRLRVRTKRVTISGNHFRGDGVGDNRIQSAVYVETAECDHVKIVNNTMQDGPSFTGATLLKILAGARCEVIGNTLISRSGGGAYLVTSLTGTVTADQIKVRHNRAVNVDGALTGLGTVDAADNFGIAGAGSGTAVSVDTFDAKGDLLVGSADNAVSRLGVGSDGQALVADSTQALGVKWAEVTGGGGSSAVGAGRLAPAGVAQLAMPGMTPFGVATVTLGQTLLWFQPFFLEKAATVDALVTEITTVGSVGSLARMGIYNADANYLPTTLVSQVDAFDVNTGGVKTQPLPTPVTLPPGRYMLAFRTDSTSGVIARRVAGGFQGGIAAAIGTNPFVSSITRTAAGGSAALEDPALAPTSSATGNAGFGCFMFLRMTSA